MPLEPHQVVVITGASAGVGRATAKAFAERHCSIGLIARNEARLEAAKRELEAMGARAIFIAADVTDAEQLEKAADRVEQELGPIDIWVNNAMATIYAPVDQVTPDEFRRSTEVTYLGLVYGTMAALKRMKPRDRGVIVQVGSGLAHRSIPLQAAYCGAKHAIIGFTDSLRSELIHDRSNVHVTVVNLPALNTPQFEWSRSRLPNHLQPMPPIFQPEVAARAIVWAASHRRREIDVAFPPVLGRIVQKIAPGVADSYLAKTSYGAQQTSEPLQPDRPDNLFSPVEGNFDAYGTFGDKAHRRSINFWFNKNRSKLAVAAAGILAAIPAFSQKHQKKQSRHRSTSIEKAKAKDDSAPVKPASTSSRALWLTAAGGLVAVGALAAGRRNGRQSGRPDHRQELPVIAENRIQVLYAWRGPAMIVLDPQGSTGSPENSGFFFRQTRYLRDLRLELFGEAPYACSAAEISPSELEFTYIYPEKAGGGSDKGGEKNKLTYQDLDLRLTYKVRPNGVDVTLRIFNRWMERAAIQVAWVLTADFADYDESFGERKQKAQIAVEQTPTGARFQYLHPQLPLETAVSAEGPGNWRYQDGRLRAELSVDRQTEVRIAVHVRAIDREDPISDEEAAAREERQRAWCGSIARVEAPGGAAIAAVANRSMRDIGSLALLDGSQEEWLVPAAGIPLFQSLWFRDALTTAWQATAFDRGEIAEAALSAAARLQGTKEDPWRDEQPGRIARGAQRSPLARLNITPMARYYGDYAAPFGFIFVLGQHYAWSGDKSVLEKHFDSARRILDWARERGDLDGDGFLEYKTLSPAGPKHQGWRDAQNAIVDEDGRQVDTPIATCEVQGYWYAAQQFMAVFSALIGSMADARAHWKNAAELKKRFNRVFWMPAERCVAIGLDAQKRPIRAITSNAAQTLATGIVCAENLPALVDRLFEPDIFSGWGIRTLSTGNPAYNPLSYHLGSIWPVENGTLLFGLRRFGFERQAQILSKALYDLALVWRGFRIPECVGGYSRSESRHPGAYPQSNAPQAWNQSVFAILVQTLLGLQPLAPLNLLAVYPLLPEWLPELTLRNLRVGDSVVSLHFKRKSNGDSTYRVLEKRGTLHVIDQPPIDSLTAGMWDRLGALTKSVFAG